VSEAAPGAQSLSFGVRARGGEVKSCSVEDGRARSGVAAEKGTPTAIGVAFNRRRERKEGLA
jgi:hypothetical protein